jgi:hypothetical protein
MELVNQNLRLSRQEGGVLPVRRPLPELDPTEPAEMAPFYPDANNSTPERIEAR